MERSIVLGGNEYRYKINFKMSYDFLKYRNRITRGFDFSKADKKVVEEIVKIQDKIKENPNDLSFMNDLSSEALAFLQDKTDKNQEIFNQEEIVDIVSKFTNITDNNKVFEILDKEIEENGYDNLIVKLTNSVAEVFTNAKETSQQVEMNKEELTAIANK